MPELVSQITPVAGVPSPSAREADRLAALRATIEAELERATTLEEGERRDLAERLNRALSAFPRDGGRAAADALQTWLEGGRLEGLVDWDGRTCRAAAAEALIALGYPYALELRPEDLEHVRATAGVGTPPGRLVSALGMVAATSGLQIVAHLPAADPLLLAHAGLTLGSAAAVALTRPLSRARRWAQGALVLAGVEGVVLSVFDAPAALLSGLAAVIAAALMSKTR